MTAEDVGLSPRESLEMALVRYLDDQYPYWQGDPYRVPRGLVLEMHPITRLKLLRDPAVRNADLTMFEILHIPVKVTMDNLQPGEWRLVLVTRDIKTGGKLT